MFRSKGAIFAALVLLIEATLVGFGLHNNLGVQALVLFPTVLVGFGMWHHDKSVVLAVGFTVLLALFLITPRIIDAHGEHHAAEPQAPGLTGYVHHFSDPHRAEVVYNLGYLLLGFALFSRYFEKSGLAKAASHFIMADIAWLRWMPPLARLLTVVYVMSAGLDNIAACLIGGLILKTMYGGRVNSIPFALFPAIIAASNLGGAASFIGDTTTTLLYIAGVSPLVLAKGFVGTALAQVVLTVWALWAVRGEEPQLLDLPADLPADPHPAVPPATSLAQWGVFGLIGLGCAVLHVATGPALLLLLVYTVVTEVQRLRSSSHDDAPHISDLGAGKGIDWPQLLPLLGIAGLVAGNLLFAQPGLGLWVGLVLGVILGKICAVMTGKTPVRLEVDAVISAVPGTVFLVLLVASAKLLPLDIVKPFMTSADPTAVTYALGVGSAIFDNIPLTSISIQLGGFDWALLSYAVGFGGSMIWLGSSAGVALGTLFPQVYDTKRWIKPALALFVVYNVGFWAIWAFWLVIVPTLSAWTPTPFWRVMTPLGGTFLCWALAGACWAYPQQVVHPVRKVLSVTLGVAGAVCLFMTFWVMGN